MAADACYWVQASQPLAAQQLSEEQQTVAAHMCALGLMKPQEVAGEMLFCPTFLAGLLCGATAQAGSAVPSVGGFIVVETSFRLYAYTSSPVQVRCQHSILFCRVYHVRTRLQTCA
jgi:transcription initiation factor TFIIH subunit 4